MGYHIVLENSAGCDLDGRYARTEEDIGGAIIELASATTFSSGDLIRVIEVEHPPKRNEGD